MSRQREWQLARLSDGRCNTCGRKKERVRKDAANCGKCAARQNARNHARYGTKPWRKGKPGRPPFGAKI